MSVRASIMDGKVTFTIEDDNSCDTFACLNAVECFFNIRLHEIIASKSSKQSTMILICREFFGFARARLLHFHHLEYCTPISTRSVDCIDESTMVGTS